MERKTTWARIAALAVPLSLVAALAPSPAPAHTSVVIVAGQIAPGGYVNGHGVVANQKIDDGPASDGVMIWMNLDPVAYNLQGQCVTPADCGTKTFSVAVPASGSKQYCGTTHGLTRGTYEYGDPSYPTMRARFRITVSTVSCAA